MQYLLTQEERDGLVPKDEVTLRDAALSVARDKILQLANFNCIHKDDESMDNGYCDLCPCSTLGRDYATWERVCWLSKRYSK